MIQQWEIKKSHGMSATHNEETRDDIGTTNGTSLMWAKVDNESRYIVLVYVS